MGCVPAGLCSGVERVVGIVRGGCLPAAPARVWGWVWWGGTLLGPEGSGARPGEAPVGWGWVVVAVFLWLFGCWIVDASIFYSCLLESSFPAAACWVVVGWLVCLCCVCVCGDKL